MSRTLLIIQGYPAAQERIERHWEWYLRAGCTILGVDRLDGRVDWPSDGLIGVRHIGMNSYVNGANLLELLLGCFEAGLSLPHFDSFAVIENDSIFVQPLPEVPKDSFLATLGGYRNDGFHGERFFHTPWIADRKTAADIVLYGRRMIDCGLLERGFPDRFLGLMVSLYKLPWVPALAFSCNRINSQHFIEESRHAIRNGVCYLHGIKTPDELATVTADL